MRANRHASGLFLSHGGLSSLRSHRLRWSCLALGQSPPAVRFFLVFSVLLPPVARSSEPEFEHPSAVNDDAHYTRSRTLLQRRRLYASVPVSTHAVRTSSRLLRAIRPCGIFHSKRTLETPWAFHQSAPCIDCRPAQPLYRVSPIVTRLVVFVHREARVRVRTISRLLGPRAFAPKVKAHTQL